MAKTNVGQELLDVPFPDMVKSMGMGIAQAQFELDQMSMRMAQMMSGNDYEMETVDPRTGEPTLEKKSGIKVEFNGEKLSLLELGFTPSFYQFVDTIIEVKMSISTSESTSSSRSKTSIDVHAKASWSPFGASASIKTSIVSASFSSKYQYSAEGANLMRTKLVPVPPPSVLQDRIRLIFEQSKAS